MKKNIVIISGAGISAESGIPTFRDTDGIWEKYNPEKVASKWAWINDKSKVLDFLNLMRREVLDKGPNEAHYIIADLERIYNVDIITTNIDDFHEKAGSTKVLHLHGEILKTRSSKNPNIKYDDTVDIRLGDKAEDGSQIRHDVVLFGEDVTRIKEAFKIVKDADILIIIGTSMSVYPANGLINGISKNCEVYIINPEYYEDQL